MRMINSISCELSPPPPPAPQLIASISRNSINSIQSYGDRHGAFFSFSSQRHLHHKEQIPAQLARNANSYHIYDDYPRYSLPIRHEKKLRNNKFHQENTVSAQVRCSRSRHSGTRKKSAERESFVGAKKIKKKEREKTPPPPPPPTLTPQLHTNICMKPRHKWNEKMDREADKLSEIEIEYEYDTDEYNEGSRVSDSKCYHVLPVQLQLQQEQQQKQKMKLVKRKSIKRKKRKSIFVDEEDKNRKIYRKKAADNRDILMKNMMEIQEEMVTHFERIRDGETNGTNPFALREDEEFHHNKVTKQKAHKIHAQLQNDDESSAKHERIASFASSQNHHLQHYHEEEELEIFATNNALQMNMNESDDALDLNEDDEDIDAAKLYQNDDDILLLPISPMESKIKKKLELLHRKTRSKSMSSILNKSRPTKNKKQRAINEEDHDVKIRRIQSVEHKKHKRGKRNRHRHETKKRKSSELKYSLTSPTCDQYEEEKEQNEDKKRRHHHHHRKKRKCRKKEKKEKRKRDKKEKKHKKHKRKKERHRSSKKYAADDAHADAENIFNAGNGLFNEYQSNFEAIKHLQIDLNAEFMIPEPKINTQSAPKDNMMNAFHLKKSKKRRRKRERERAKALKLSQKLRTNSATTATKTRRSLPQLQNRHTEIIPIVHAQRSSKANVVLPISPDFKSHSRSMLNNRLSSASETQAISYKKYGTAAMQNINYFNFDRAINDTFIPIPPPPKAKKLNDVI